MKIFSLHSIDFRPIRKVVKKLSGSSWIHVSSVYKLLTCRFWGILEKEHIQTVSQTHVLCLGAHHWSQVTADSLFECVCLSLFLIVHLKNTDPGVCRVLRWIIQLLKGWNCQFRCLTLLHWRWRFLICWSASDSVFVFPGSSALRVVSDSSILYQRLPHRSFSRLVPKYLE